MIFKLILRPLYIFVLQPVIFGFVLLFGQWVNPKIRAGVQLRLKFRFPEGSKNSNPIWIHCSSGEFEYAKPVIREIKSKSPEQKILVTYFSPTYVKNILKDDFVDFCCPLPWDLPGPLRSFINHFQPKQLIIARTDLWPECLFQCRSLGVKTTLFSSTKSKISFLEKLGISPIKLLDQVFTVSEEDLENIKIIAPNVPVKNIGDTRFDQAFYRLENPNPIKTELFSGSTPVFAMGSSWEEDEKELLPHLAPIAKNGNLKILVAPHEPTADHLQDLVKLLDSLGLSHSMYSQAKDWTDENVLIIDQVGILADIYAHTKWSFVGGSFKKSVHSVMEPLAAGNVVFVGPYHTNNREALQLSQTGLVKILNQGEDVCHFDFQSDTATADVANRVKELKGSSSLLIEHLL